MTVLSAQTIRQYGLVSPFVEGKPKEFGMSYGLSIAGYDIRTSMIDTDEFIRVERGGFVLLTSLEKFNMPDNIIGFVKDKSSWARQGVAVQNTVLEPGWRGFLTLELSNHGRNSILIHPGQPIAQVIFQFTDCHVEQPYSGKYQDQPQIPLGPIMEWE